MLNAAGNASELLLTSAINVDAKRSFYTSILSPLIKSTIDFDGFLPFFLSDVDHIITSRDSNAVADN